MNANEIDTVVCPDGYTFIKPHIKGNTLVNGYCRQTPRAKKIKLAREGIAAIPFGYDAEVIDDYGKYEYSKVKKQ